MAMFGVEAATRARLAREAAGGSLASLGMTCAGPGSYLCTLAVPRLGVMRGGGIDLVGPGGGIVRARTT